MKRFILFCALWILALCFMLAGVWAGVQDTTEYRTTVVERITGTLSGAGLVEHARAAPIVEQATDWLTTIKDIVSGALVVITSLLAWLAKNKADKAAVVPILIRAIEDHGTASLKASISNAARDSGVADVLHASVQAETKNDTPFKPRDYASELTAKLPPVANLPPTDEIKPI